MGKNIIFTLFHYSALLSENQEDIGSSPASATDLDLVHTVQMRFRKGNAHPAVSQQGHKLDITCKVTCKWKGIYKA